MADKRFVEDVRGIVPPGGAAAAGALPPAPARASIGVSAGTSLAAQGGAGIASPLTEVSRTTKDVIVQVPLGATSIVVEAIVTLNMVDANGREVALVLK